MKIIDVSWEIDQGMVVYPNNPSVSFEVVQEMPESQTRLTKLVLGTHTGTHVDAPRHGSLQGKSVDELDLEIFYGKCRVVDLTGVTGGISVADLKTNEVKEGERVLFKTKNSGRGRDKFVSDYVYLSGDGADYLANIKVKLVGIDYLSIKEKGSKDTRAHNSLLDRGIPIIEALDLSGASGGEYTLVALPLRLKGLDGSPVRAVLIKK